MPKELIENKRALVVNIGGEAFIECLSKHGQSATLDLLIKVSPQGGWIVEELLCMLVSTCAIAGFLKRVPQFQVTEEEFRHWCDSPEFMYGAKRPSIGATCEEGEVVKILSRFTQKDGKVAFKK